MQDKLKEAKYSYDPEDQYQVGLMFRDGIEVEQDYKQAKDWFRRAAFKEHAASQFNLAVISAKKLAGAFSSDYETKSWLKKAAKQDHAGAKKLLEMVEAGDDLPEPKALFSLDTSAAAAAALPEPTPISTEEPEPSPAPEPEPSPTPEPEPSPTPEPEPSLTPEPEPSLTPEPEPSPVPKPETTSSVEKPDLTPVAKLESPAITKQSAPPSAPPHKSEETVEAPQTPPPPPVIAEKGTPSPPPPAIRQPSAGAIVFDKDLAVATTQYQPDDIAEYSGEPWDIRISMDHAPLEEAFYFPVKDDPDATNESIQSVLEKYALNTDRSNELDSDEYPQLPHIQEELRDYYESGKSGQINLSIHVNKRPSGEPIQLGDTVSQHLSSCVFHDGSFDYRLLDLVFVIESKSMESSELEQYRQEYGHTFMVFLVDYMKRNSSAAPDDALFSSDPFRSFLSGSNDPDQFPKVTQALKSAESAGFIQLSTPSQIFAKNLPGATTKYQPDDLAEYSGEPWDIRISMNHDTLEDAFYFPVKDDPDATNESIQSVLEKYALNTDRSNELDSGEYPLMPILQKELRGYYNSGKSGQAKLSIYVNKRPSGGPIQLEDPVAQHLSTCVFNDGSFDYRLLDLVFVIEDRISITQKGNEQLESIKQEVKSLTNHFERYQSVVGNPPALGVPNGYDARIQLMRRNSVDVVRAIFLFAFIYNEDDLFGDHNWATSYESGQSFSDIMDAFKYESKFSDKILDALVSL